MKKYFLTILVYLILAVLTIIFIRNNYGDFASIPEISVFYFSLMILVSFISLFVNGLRIKLFGDYYNINLKKKEWFGLAAVTTMDNYLTPFRGGVAVRALYLRKVYNFPFKSFLTTIVASYTIRILIYSLFGIILSIISLTYYEIFNLWVFILFIGLFLISLIIVLFSP
ncbi:flippase-like domain-containing protein, partial [Candidatus Woesearchaeota archaeon]|nr:flippase-like domain-containing protein [Candidatus Woesearchaeota archaeon]